MLIKQTQSGKLCFHVIWKIRHHLVEKEGWPEKNIKIKDYGLDCYVTLTIN